MSQIAAQITTLTNVQINEPKFQALLERFQDTIELSFRKALAHEGAPGDFPLSSEKSSLEAVFAQVVQQVPAEKKAAAIQNALAEAKQAHATPLSGVNLRIATPIQEQVRALPLPGRLTSDELTRIIQIVTRPSSQGASAPAPFQQVELQLLKLKCVQKAKEPFEGLNEIAGGAVQVDQDGKVSKMSSINFGQFDEGDVKNFSPPTRLATIPVNNKPFPLALALAVTLAEMDSDKVADVLDVAFQAVKAVKGQIVDAISALLGLSSDSSSSSTSSTGAGAEVLVVLLGIAVGAVIELTQDLLGKWFHSDVFDDQMAMVALPSATSLFPTGSTNSEEETLTFTSTHFKGKYTATIRWHVA